MSSPYGLPHKVSPLIRFARWCALGYGIYFGFEQNRKYYAQEKVVRDEFESIRPIIEKAIREERQKQSDKAIEDIVAIFMPELQHEPESLPKE